MTSDKMLLVLTVLQGRHFPKIASGQLIIEARFDGELMTTDPVEHTSDPNFNTDLAWEVDRRGLHHLKIARTPIKLQCFAVDKKNFKSAVGYIIMDLRMAQFQSMKPKWYPILNSKYSSKPELLLTMGLEDDDHTPAATKVQLPSALKFPTNLPTKQPTVKAPAPKFEYSEAELKPSLDSEEGHYQIGPADKCTDIFSFSVTIGFAANLEQLIPTTVRLPSVHRGFFFYYSLLGNDILTDYFPDLAQAEFAAERASIKLRSSIPALRAFFYHQSGMQVHICCGEMSLGWAEVPLADLLKQNSTDIFMQPVILENSYELKTSRQSQMSVNEGPDMLKPIVGIVLTMKREDQLYSRIDPVALNAESKVPLTQDKDPPAEQSSPISKRPCPQTPPQKLTKNAVAQQLHPVPMIDLSSSSSDAEMPPETPLIDGSPMSPQDSVNEISDSSPMYKYSLAVDLRSIRNHNIPLPFKCFLRYSYPHFGKMAPIQTHPAVEVLRGRTVFLPHGSTVFKFTALPSLLDTNFRQCPLTVDVMHQDVSSEELLIGQAVVSLSGLLDQKKLASMDDRGQAIWKRNLTQTIPVINKSMLHVADLHTALVLEDLGLNETSPVHRMMPSEPKLKEHTAKPASASNSKPQALEDSLAEKVAYELEQWKEWQEAIFMKQLQEREARHMEAISAEWAQRETEREMLLKKKLSEYQTLEDTLKPGISNLEKREQELRTKEAELQRMKTDLQAEYDRQVQEVKDASRRLKEECAHKLELEKSNNKVLQDQCAKLRKELSEMQRKYDVKDTEFQAYKDKKTQPEIKLQSEFKLLSLEKTELERKIDALTKSKVHYKQQYARCLKELARLKQGMQAETVSQLKKQQQELEQMRLQILAAEQQKNLREPRGDLEELKSELKSMAQTMEANVVKQRGNGPSATAASGMPSQSNPAGIDSSIINKVHESCLAHLVQEKETLLKTGMYPLDDPVIVEIDKQIKALILNMKR